MFEESVKIAEAFESLEEVEVKRLDVSVEFVLPPVNTSANFELEEFPEFG